MSSNTVHSVTKEEFEENIKIMSFFAKFTKGECVTGKGTSHWYQILVTPDQVRQLAKIFGLPVRGAKDHPRFSFFGGTEWNFDENNMLVSYDVYTGLVGTDWTVGVENV